MLSNGFEQYVAHAATFFEIEMPALREWSLTEENAKRITQPVLAIVGETSREYDNIWAERHEWLLDWLPNAELFVLAGASHLLQIEQPRRMAEGMADFFARHPVTVA